MNDLHVIIDIDQTILDSMNRFDYIQNRKNLREPDFYHETLDIYIWLRPHLEDFIKFLDKNVKYISIWTNGTYAWLYYVVNTILVKFVSPKRFLLLLSVDNSTPYEIRETNVILRLYVKEINKIIDKIKNKNITLKNTVLIDDNYYNCFYNRNNTIPIKKFLAMEERIKPRQRDLLLVKDIIIQLHSSSDVSNTLDKVYNDIKDYSKLFTNKN